MLRHGRIFFGRLTGQTARLQKRTRRSASLQEKGPIPHWRATVPRGRNPKPPDKKTDVTERVPPGKGPDPPLEGHGPSWPQKTAPNGGPCSVMAASCSAALRDKPQSPKNGRDGARPSRKRARSRIGGPRSLVAAKDGTQRRAMLRHGRLLPGRLTGQTARPQKRTRRSASLQEKGPILHWRATVPRGRKRRHPMEGHALSWPPLARPPYGTNRKAPKTDATERVPPGKGPDPPLEGHGPSWPRANAAFHGGPCFVMAVSRPAALRDKPQSPKNGRDGARPSRKRARSFIGGPRSLVAAKDGTQWRAMLRHGRLLPGRHTGQTARPQKRTRRSASLQERPPNPSNP
jgi:hypothetical protein